jgi:hypothetical protein
MGGKEKKGVNMINILYMTYIHGNVTTKHPVYIS